MYLLFIPFQAKAERTVHHFHFTQWPDHGVPDKIKLVSFYRKVKLRCLMAANSSK
jgi:protein tyrosine phosphatase